ncbi:MAG: hypothetical protein HFJ41_00745 [Clostridia bacterium]|nr:hypothetical protein [Clostridia bacterium]
MTTINITPTKTRLTKAKFNKTEHFILESKFLGTDKIVCVTEIVRIIAIASLVPILESLIKKSIL